MKFRRLYVLAGIAVLIVLLMSGVASSGLGGMMTGSQANFDTDSSGHLLNPPPFPDAYKLHQGPPSASVPGVITTDTDGLSHPCSGLIPEPPFAGLSPIAIAYPYTNCAPYWMMGDVATWQYQGHDYVGLSGFEYRMFFIYNVDDPYNPVLLHDEGFPSSGTASLSIFDWKQNGNQYLSVTMRGSGTGCGFFVYNVNDPYNPQFVTRKSGADWCTVHEHFVSLDENGNADYAWLTMSGESGSGTKIVALDIHNLANIFEVNRYQRPSAGFAHDSNVVRGRVYVADWDGGLQIFDENAFVSGATPTPLNPLDSIRPSSFLIHHAVPTTDDRYVFVQDEFINNPSLGKVKMYDISNISSPQFVADIVGGDSVAASNRAHNMVIKPLGPGLDLLLDAWYRAGIRGNLINTIENPPTITQVFRQQLNSDTSGSWDDVWGVDWLPCNLRGLQRTCLYAGDMKFGLVVNAVNTDTFQPDPSLDPYNPDVPVITSPANGQEIDGCAITITGTAHDYWSGLQRVEVSVDNGSTWHTAGGTDNWSYEWNIMSSGPVTIKARAFDMADNMANAVDINVTVTASCPLTTPTVAPTYTMLPTGTNTAIANTPTHTSTSTPTSTPVPTSTPTEVATDTPTSTPTNTVAAPTGTATAVEATETPVIEPTGTAIELPTDTAVTTATATATSCTMSFSDVTETDWYYAFVHCLYCHGIIGGYSDGTFRPNNEITRGQIAKIVAMAAGFDDVVSEQSFEDVSPASTFYPWIGQLYMHGVISGYACGGPGEPCGAASMPYFRPGGQATRGQMAKIVVMAAVLPVNTGGGPHFSDVAEGSTFYDYVETMYNAGAINGYPDGTFHPSSNVTRAQAAKMVVLVFFPDCVTR